MSCLARALCKAYKHQKLASSSPLTSVRNFYLYSPEPLHPIKGKEPQWMTSDEAVGMIRSGDNVYVHGGVCTPYVLLDALGRRGLQNELQHIKIWSILLDTGLSNREYDGVFRLQNLFVHGDLARNAIADGRGDYIPIFLSEIPLLFRRNLVKLDVALIQVTPPDRHGYCSLGATVDATRCAIQNAKHIIAQVNPQMPRTFGDGNMHISHLDALVEGDNILPVFGPSDPRPEEDAVGRLISSCLVQDGATLQVGIGSVPQTSLKHMEGHRDIGIHSELFDDAVIDLVEKGVITNAKKSIHTGKIVSSISVGTQRLYEFIDNNPFIVMNDVSFTNNISVIMQNPKVTAINSCIEIDITGQVVSDSIGTSIYSGVGGQIDFLRAAAQCTDGLGKPILGMPSTTASGESKIVPFIKQGSGVVTTRAHVHFIVTEFGIAYLFGKNLRQRAYEMIRLAHPDHREYLEQCAFDRLGCMPSPD